MRSRKTKKLLGQSLFPSTILGTSERHDDEPASHTEAANVLADVDIYVVYGRHSQAIDLLNNAIASEPDNPLYRRKLSEIEGQVHGATSSELQIEEQDLLRDGGG